MISIVLNVSFTLEEMTEENAQRVRSFAESIGARVNLPRSAPINSSNGTAEERQARDAYFSDFGKAFRPNKSQIQRIKAGQLTTLQAIQETRDAIANGGSIPDTESTPEDTPPRHDDVDIDPY